MTEKFRRLYAINSWIAHQHGWFTLPQLLDAMHPKNEDDRLAFSLLAQARLKEKRFVRRTVDGLQQFKLERSILSTLSPAPPSWASTLHLVQRTEPVKKGESYEDFLARGGTPEYL